MTFQANRAAAPPRPIQRGRRYSRITVALTFAACVTAACSACVGAGQLRAGTGKVDITHRAAGPVNDPLYTKALVLANDQATVAIVTVDAVAIGEIGPIANDYLTTVRGRIEKELGIAPAHVLINASHCHGVVCDDVAERTFEAVAQAAKNMTPVRVGAGVGREERISENRRLSLKNGREVDVRQAYALPPDEEVASVGPIDPEIGVLRFDTLDGRTVAVVYNFACHPIQGVPSGGNSADLVGFASRTIEENLSDGALALFLQGCAGDINPVFYKAVDRPRDAEPLGNLLGLSTLRAVRAIECRDDDRLEVRNEVLELPRADLGERIISLEAERERLLTSLQGTQLNLKTFLPLAVKYNLSSEFPAYYSHRYLHEEQQGREDMRNLDAANRRDLAQYVRNVHTMEQLTRVQTNLALLRKHQATNLSAPMRTIDAEIVALRMGDFRLVTFPGEPTVEIGLNIKGRSPHELTFVAGYTNGYLYYAPTAEQLRNVGGAQEDSECLLAPEWQKAYEDRAEQMLRGL